MMKGGVKLSTFIAVMEEHQMMNQKQVEKGSKDNGGGAMMVVSSGSSYESEEWYSPGERKTGSPLCIPYPIQYSSKPSSFPKQSHTNLSHLDTPEDMYTAIGGASSSEDLTGAMSDLSLNSSHLPSHIDLRAKPLSSDSIQLSAVTQCIKRANSIESSASTYVTNNSLDSSKCYVTTLQDKSMMRPRLYSAIGSLETSSENSFGKIRSKYGKRCGYPKQFGVDTANRDANSSQMACTERQHRRNDSAGQRLGADHTEMIGGSHPYLNQGKNACRDSRERDGGRDASGLRKVRRLPKRVTVNGVVKAPRARARKKKPREVFRPSSDAYTPRMNRKQNIEYKPAEQRTPVQNISSETMGTISRPNFRDALRRVAMILHQHVVKIEQRIEDSKEGGIRDGLFRTSMLETFSEERFATPKFRCSMVRLPMARPGMIYGMRKLQDAPRIPTEKEIYDFGHQLFNSVQLSSECSIVCLIYVERLMECAKVPLVATTWRPIFMCGLLLASKVWQDLSSWNIEFASVYPQYPLHTINKLELEFLKLVKWDLYISSSLYAKYYFALRSLLEKSDFRQRYNRMVGGVGSVSASHALKIQQRSELIKEEALMHLSRSM